VLALAISSFHFGSLSPDDSVGTRPLSLSVCCNQTTIFAAFLTDQHSSHVLDFLSHIAASAALRNAQCAFESWLVNFTSHNNTRHRFLYPPDDFRTAKLLNRKIRRFRGTSISGASFSLHCESSSRTRPHNGRTGWDHTMVNFGNLGLSIRCAGRANPLPEAAVVGHCIGRNLITSKKW
jgi:hypothetical protein